MAHHGLIRVVLVLFISTVLFVPNVLAEIVDNFESYELEQPVCGAGNWNANSSYGSCDVFVVSEEGDGNKVLRVEHSQGNSATKSIAELNGVVNLQWRWKTEDAEGIVAFGPATVPNSNPGSWNDYRVRVVMEKGRWACKDNGWVTLSENPSVLAGVWYYMRLELNFSTNTYNLFVSESAERTDETALVIDGTMEGTGACSALMVKTDSESGTLVLDDITVGMPDEDYTDWAHSMKINMNTASDGVDVAEDVSDLPILVRLNTENFSFNQAHEQGHDVRFSGFDGEPLAYKIASWDKANETAAIWVNVPLIGGNKASQYITMYWGNPGSLDHSASQGVFETATGYAGVWHLDGEALDATENGNNGTLNGDMSFESDGSPGIAGEALVFDGSDDYIEVGAVTELDLGGAVQEFTITSWIKPASSQSTDGGIIGRWNGAGEHQFVLKYESDGDLIKFAVHDGDYQVAASETNSIAGGNWYYVVGVAKDGDLNVYLNGSLSGTIEGYDDITLIDENVPLRIGREGDSPVNYFSGKIDEITLSRVARSPGWIKISYLNQMMNQSFLSYGPAESVLASPTDLQVTVNGNGVQLSWFDNAETETGYEIHYGLSETELTLLAELPANSQNYTHGITDCGLAYYYAITAVSESGASPFASTAEPAYTIPCIPSSLSAETKSASQIDVSWDGNAPKFLLEAKSGDVWNPIYEGNATSFAHQPLECGVSRQYRVKSMVPDGRSSDFTESVSATTEYCPVESPSSLVADASVPDRIDLSWSNNAEEAVGYKIYRNQEGGAFTAIEDFVPVENPVYLDTDVQCETNYSYYVVAYDNYSESGPSNTVSTETSYCGAGKLTSEMLTITEMVLDETGEPFSGEKLISFKLYGNSAGSGEPLHVEAFENLDIKNGMLIMYPGLTKDVADVIRENESLYYDILIDGESVLDDALRPLTASAYSIKNSNSLSGAGSPVDNEMKAPVGATYVDTDARQLYVKFGESSSDWQKVGDLY